jgi:hypothetical protein
MGLSRSGRLEDRPKPAGCVAVNFAIMLRTDSPPAATRSIDPSVGSTPVATSKVSASDGSLDTAAAAAAAAAASFSVTRGTGR